MIGFAQSPVRPEFDVATVKVSPPASGDSIVINLGRAVNGKVELSNATLSDCIKFAYGIASDAQLAIPEWINSRSTIRFEIVQINGQPIDLAGPSLYTAVQEQLGLKLESRKGPVELLVVDSSD